MSNLRTELSTAAKVIGFRQVKREVASVKHVILADDADLVLKEEVRSLCKANGIAIEAVPSKKELGEMCGIDVSCAVVGLTA